MRRPRPGRRMLEVVGGQIRRLLELEVIDRSLVVGAQAFSALVPLLIVLSSVGSDDGRTFADGLVDRYGITGPAADTVRGAFDSPAAEGGLTALSVVFVVLSALAFTRALQRTFELAWGLERRGLRSTGWGLAWLAFLTAYVSTVPAIREALPSGIDTAVALTASGALWLVTPYLLLAGRVGWRRLAPQATFTVAGMTALGAAIAVYAPRAMSSAASQFGAIGVAFTLLTILWAAGFVLVCAAGIGSSISNPSWPSASPGSATQTSSSSSPTLAS